MFSLPSILIVLATSFPLAPALAQTNGNNDNGWLVKWHPGHVEPANRRTWIDNQLRKASLPALTDAEVSSLKVSLVPIPHPIPLYRCYFDVMVMFGLMVMLTLVPIHTTACQPRSVCLVALSPCRLATYQIWNVECGI
jgi:hypothetical protein